MIKVENPREVVLYFDKKIVLKNIKETWLLEDWIVIFNTDDLVKILPRNRVTYVLADPDKVNIHIESRR